MLVVQYITAFLLLSRKYCPVDGIVLVRELKKLCLLLHHGKSFFLGK